MRQQTPIQGSLGCSSIYCWMVCVKETDRQTEKEIFCRATQVTCRHCASLPLVPESWEFGKYHINKSWASLAPRGTWQLGSCWPWVAAWASPVGTQPPSGWKDHISNMPGKAALTQPVHEAPHRLLALECQVGLAMLGPVATARSTKMQKIKPTPWHSTDHGKDICR
jgi:hypothetical protein